jgi:hypothetical protein
MSVPAPAWQTENTGAGPGSEQTLNQEAVGNRTGFRPQGLAVRSRKKTARRFRRAFEPEGAFSQGAAGEKRAGERRILPLLFSVWCFPRRTGMFRARRSSSRPLAEAQGASVPRQPPPGHAVFGPGQALPTPLPSVSAWSALATYGQLSRWFTMPSPSRSLL